MINGLIKSLNSKSYILNSSNGFTLIELIITIGITAILASVGFINLYGYFQRKNLDLAGQEITAVLRNAQNNSISQEGGNRWGVHFENTTSSADSDFYELFSGASYSTSSVAQKFALSSGINFSSPPAGQNTNVFFTPVTGQTSSTVISVIGSVGGVVKDVIIKSNGGVVDSLEEGLVGYWHFNEGLATSTYDASGYGNNGSLTNYPGLESGLNCKSGKCLSFNGTDEYATIPGANLMPSNITLAAWVNVVSETGGSEKWIMSMPYTGAPFESYGFRWYLSGSQYNLKFDTSKAEAITVIPMSFGTMYYFVGTYDGSVARLYINGTEADTGNGTGALTYLGDYPFYIGSRITTSNSTNVIVDEVRIYNRALSATEVLKLYNDFK